MIPPNRPRRIGLRACGAARFRLRGEKEARGMAHELEREVRRRFGNPQAETQHSLKEVRVLGELP